MSTLTLEKTYLPILKSSLDTQQKLLHMKLQNYKKRLKEFEKKHKLPSNRFYKKFLQGQLGDDDYLIEWEFLYESYLKIKEQISKINSIRL